jgi:Tectonin domain
MQIGFSRLPGLAKDIGVAGSGSEGAWVIGTNPVGTAQDFGIFRWAGDIETWVSVDGGGVRIAVEGIPTNPWIVNSAGEIFRRVNNQWERLPGLANDVGVGGAGAAWIIGTNRVGTSGDFGIFKWTGTEWEEVEGGGVAIAVDGAGIPWVINSNGEIFRRSQDHWVKLPGLAKDIGVSFHGFAWIIGTNRVGTSGDFGIFKWTGTEWEEITGGGGVRISVDEGLPGGRPWVVNAAGQIFSGHLVPS